MNSYHALANCYDQLTTDINYKEWADYLHKHLKNHNIPGNIVLDLACGTGSISLELAKLGYEMIAVDLSPDMLSQAMEKFEDFSGERPIFLCQSMDKLDLFGTIDACVSCLDSINYVTDIQILQKAFQRVSLFLMPDGVFIFDIKSPSAFQAQNGQFSLDETEDIFCVWRTELQDDMAQHFLDIFQKEGNLWRRDQEIHKQRLYSVKILKEMLEKAGFPSVECFASHSFEKPSPQEERIFFVCKKKL